MTFEEILNQAIAMLQRRGRLTYRALQRQFNLDDAYLEDLKAELIQGQRLAIDEEGAVLVWTGGTDVPPRTHAPAPQPVGQPGTSEAPRMQVLPLLDALQSLDAERRQLTVMFCDLVESTKLASQLDPEELREVVRAYQQVCSAVITQFDGHIAQLLGDGLLVYFGYPQAHEDDARRAVQSGLGMVAAMGTLNARLEHAHGIRLAVRVGIHTGLVVVGTMGAGRQEQLAVGETPNVAARVQGLTAPDTVVISEATARLVQGYFTWQDLGPHTLRGVSAPLQLYRVLQESGAQSRLDATMGRGLTPLVGREAEVTLLLERWQQVHDGLGHVVLLSGEAGMGKSRLVQVLKDRVVGESSRSIECRCLPYYQHSALAPVITYLQRALDLHGEDAPSEKLRKLEGALAQHPLPLAAVVPLFAALLAIPLSEQYPPRTLTPQQQRQQTLEALLAWLLAEAAQQPVLFIVEDLHWVDPSTVEFLSLVVDHGPTARLCSLFTFRPHFAPPWTPRAHLIPMALSHLSPSQTANMVERVAGGKALPAEVQRQIVAKTDGVPLAVEELTKMILESGVLREQEDRYTLIGPLPPLAIPATLHDALMARLDRLAPVKAVAQLGATIGRTFSYDLLHAVAPFEEATLQTGLRQLVEAELLYQSGVPPQVTYLFKHALIQEAAYQSLLRSTRQRYHQRIAQVLEAQFPESATTQPELLAQHYTEAGLREPAVVYWQRAGQQAVAHSAHLEAISHFTHGLELLQSLPETPEHIWQELDVQIALGQALMAAKGQGVPEVEHAYTRARTLCQQLGETPQLFPVLWGLWRFYFVQAQYQIARELGEQCLSLAQRVQDSALLLVAHYTLGMTGCFLGEVTLARAHLEQGLALYAPQEHRQLASRYGLDLGVWCLSYVSWPLWLLGYPDQARARSHAAITLAQELSHPLSLAAALSYAAWLHYARREGTAVQERAEAAIVLAIERSFPQYLALATMLRGWALAMQDQGEEGITQIHQGLTTWRATGIEASRTFTLTLLAEAYGKGGEAAEGLRVLAEALALVEQNGERFWEAELHRLKGALLLVQEGTRQRAEAEVHFQQALDIARRQQAKLLELRAAVSLSRLWQSQGKHAEARALLAPIYDWFTEGFDTADLQDAKALLEELA